MPEPERSAPPKEWNAGAYHHLSAPQFAWGQRVMDGVTWRGNERVLDAGCGSGRLTMLLVERVPAGSVVALDRSFNMASQAHVTLGGTAPAAQARDLRPRASPGVVQADLLALPFQAAFDVVFSTATFHWVLDHDALFAQLHAALKPGGRLVAQCGGGPNLDRMHARAIEVARTPAYARYFEGWRNPWEFASAEVTASRLDRAGFVEIETSLEEAPTVLPDAGTYASFVSTVILRTHLARLPDEALREGFMARITEEASLEDPPFFLDYWRLNIRARRPAR